MENIIFCAVPFQKNQVEGVPRCLQSSAKYIWNLLGFTKSLDLNRTFNVASWLFSTR